MSINLFGTDGIRGKINLAPGNEEEAVTNLIENREISPPILRLIGESLGRSVEDASREKPRVVIGWDDRPANPELVRSLTIGLNIADFEVTHIGLCATPTLHYATLFFDADFGCMITASHNPVDDSGLKIFTKYGYKTTPEFELELSHNAISLSQEDREIDQIDSKKLSEPSMSFESSQWCIHNHPKWLSSRYENLTEMVQSNLAYSKNINYPLLIDSSKGTGQFWLSEWLSNNGIEATEVSHQATALNQNCGAGDLSPTQEWTFEEAKQSTHILIKQLPICEPGTLVAAALDGDGDRCLLIETTSTGFKVIDGDRIADTFVNCVTNSGFEWHLAASIESDLSLTTNLERYPKQVRVSETAVGDRWLSFKLSASENNQLVVGKSFPQVIGVEDSGHLVMPSPHPNISECWSLVGDGAMTLVAYLLSLSRFEPSTAMKRGWKQRQSIKNVDRTKWDGENQLSNMVEQSLRKKLSEFGDVSLWERTTVAGENNLMLINCSFSASKLSIGVRNSGTQAKISVSARLEYGGTSNGIQDAIDVVCDLLAKHMVNH